MEGISKSRLNSLKKQKPQADLNYNSDSMDESASSNDDESEKENKSDTESDSDNTKNKTINKPQDKKNRKRSRSPSTDREEKNKKHDTDSDSDNTKNKTTNKTQNKKNRKRSRSPSTDREGKNKKHNTKKRARSSSTHSNDKGETGSRKNKKRINNKKRSRSTSADTTDHSDTSTDSDTQNRNKKNKNKIKKHTKNSKNKKNKPTIPKPNLPEDWESSKTHYDTNRVYGLDLPRRTVAGRQSSSMGYAGLDPLEIPLYKVLWGQESSYDIRLAASGRFSVCKILRSMDEVNLTNSLLKRFRSKDANAAPSLKALVQTIANEQGCDITTRDGRNQVWKTFTDQIVELCCKITGQANGNVLQDKIDDLIQQISNLTDKLSQAQERNSNLNAKIIELVSKPNRTNPQNAAPNMNLMNIQNLEEEDEENETMSTDELLREVANRGKEQQLRHVTIDKVNTANVQKVCTILKVTETEKNEWNRITNRLTEAINQLPPLEQTAKINLVRGMAVEWGLPIDLAAGGRTKPNTRALIELIGLAYIAAKRNQNA